MSEYQYKRVLLKISGEALMGNADYGIDPNVVERMAVQVKQLHDEGIEVAVVVGGGNIFRGVAGSAKGMERAQADYMGMLATVMNALALQDAIERIDCPCRVMSGIQMNEVCEPYIRRRAMRSLEKGDVVIFAAGSGNPYFTTDTAAALRACEIGADCLLKATKVDGVYDMDPVKNEDAVRLTASAIMRSWSVVSRSWIRPRPRCARTTTCRSSFSTSTGTTISSVHLPVSRWAPSLWKRSRECLISAKAWIRPLRA